MNKIMTWCTGLALIAAVAGCGQSAAVRAAGSWGQAIEVPGLAALNEAGHAGVASVSCASAGNCAVGGSYRDRHRHDQGFLAVERHGRWGKAIEVPGLGVLNTGRSQYIGGRVGVVGVVRRGGQLRRWRFLCQWRGSPRRRGPVGRH